MTGLHQAAVIHVSANSGELRETPVTTHQGSVSSTQVLRAERNRLDSSLHPQSRPTAGQLVNISEPVCTHGDQESLPTRDALAFTTSRGCIKTTGPRRPRPVAAQGSVKPGAPQGSHPRFARRRTGRGPGQGCPVAAQGPTRLEARLCPTPQEGGLGELLSSLKPRGGGGPRAPRAVGVDAGR